MMTRKRGCLLGGVLLLVCVGVVIGVIVYLTNNRPDPSPLEDLVVTIEGQGRVRGAVNVAYSSNVSYYAFYGVPYALPPVGVLRFKAPRLPIPWSGVRNATEETVEPCSQMINGLFAGSEDCLYLNVYTPALPRETINVNLPVYFFIHGGLFQGGSPSTEMYGPDFLVQQDIVIVTIQYRVNSLGFGSLDTEEIPGNCALKDIIAALKWVNRNIAKFGGDPNKVTVGGQSAGGALASWMTILPETKGLISQAIVQSGTAYHNWAYKEDHIEMGLRLASLISAQNVTDIKTAERILMETASEKLTTATYQLIAEKMKSQPDLPYQPTPERRTAVPNGEPLLVTHDAESYFLEPPAPHVPQIIGICNEEWRFYYFNNNPKSDPQVDEQLLENLQAHVPKNLIPFSDSRRVLGLSERKDFDYDEVIEKVKQGIRNSVSSSCSLGCVLKKYFDGIWMATDTHRIGAYLAARNETVYLFRFGVRSVLNQPFSIDPVPEDEKNAAQHGDDLPYAWLFRIHSESSLSEEAALARRRVVAMWTNFIKYGKPTPVKTDLLPVDWLPNSQTNLEVTFLDISGNLKLRSESLAGEMVSFWNGLYNEYRSNVAVSTHTNSV
ncbi:Carboxyl/Cholinesterase 46 [Frankliniella occidentalis]|uniref:Carboxylic ester hydrolase n=1 Tax=Frankliniella occidentalis TaxID=133901 RepID=A0A6J1T3R2_FRAOC|nr:esterase E4-like [Frankliniella occidentalis]KAE8740592.1 Carboxyl/Cholinesterase 46 [Frankliniella occidentalis]